MKLTTIAAALAVALPLAMAGAAQAAPDNTGTLELGYTRVNTSGTNPNYGFNSIEARGGLQFNKNLGVEMEGGVGVGNQTVHSGGVSVSVKEDWEVGVFGVGYLPVGHDIDLYGRLGYSRTQITASSGSFSIAGQGNGAAAGVGVRGFINGGKNGWRLDYTHHFYQGSSSDTFGATYVRRF